MALNFETMALPLPFMPEMEESRSMRILVLDDDPMFLKMIQRMGEKHGVHITTCRSSREFSTKEELAKFDVAVIDYQLSDGSIGTDVAQRMGKLPVVMISQSSHWTREHNVWPMSVRAFVHKRYGLEKIFNTAVDIGWKTRPTM